MGRWHEAWAREALRVLKPGGHLIAFGGSRTYHRLASAIEDAGFEIRDQIMWLYGSGFPKSHNLDGEWEGWGTALKPAHEPIVMARKPLVGTVAANVEQWGVGAINIDGCRIESPGEVIANHGHTAESDKGKSAFGDFAGIPPHQTDGQRLGRFPANLIHDGSDEVLSGFPAQAGASGKASGPTLRDGNTSVARGKFNGLAAGREPAFHNDSGSAARFFYCAKASKADRDHGLENFAKQKAGMLSETSGQHMTRRDEGYEVAPRANTHPTVKPTELMRYLCRLVTPPGGHVLDPFLGSGSTGRGAIMEGFDFTGIELTEEYVPIARARIAAVTPAVGVFA